MAEAKSGFITTTVEVEGRTETRVVERPAFEPTPWGTDAALTHVGQSPPRVDAPEKVTGRARYTADIQRPRQAVALFLRSTVAKGTITHFDATAARAIPGVLAVMGPGDAPAKTRLFPTAISYAGQPIAAVCAESESVAWRALRAIVVQIDSLPFAATFEATAAADAPKVRSAGNLAEPIVVSRGDIAAGLAAAEVTITREYRTPVALHSAMEPHGAVAEWEGDRLTIWESTQGIFRTRNDVARVLGIAQSQVRVIKEYMGGGFGAKNGAGAHTFTAALFAKQLQRPVRCVLERDGEQMDSGNRPATTQRVTLGARRDGTLTAIQLDADVPLGISGWEGGPAQLYHELYACANVHTTERFAYINASGMQAFRAPGYAEGAIGLEGAMNALATTLGIDPLELRRRNFAERDPRLDRPFTGNALRQCYDEAAERFGWTAPRPAPDRAHPERARGRGVAAQTWPTGGGPPAYATARLNNDGSIEIASGTQDLGTGARTVLAQIAADAFGAALHDVRVVLGDTERAPYAGNSWGSMTTASVGPAVRMAAEDARAKLLDAASQLLNVPADALETRESRIIVRDTDRTMTFAEVTGKLGNVMIQGRGSRGPNPSDRAIVTVGVQMAEVEVDRTTGVVRVLRIVAAHDCGRVINPTLARSQLEGGILQGLGYALFEERRLDGATGVPLNPSLHDYKIPTMADCPAIDAWCVQNVDAEANHTGARGLAEPPLIPTAPAIAAAVADALGVEVCELPLTPWRVLAALG